MLAKIKCLLDSDLSSWSQKESGKKWYVYRFGGFVFFSGLKMFVRNGEDLSIFLPSAPGTARAKKKQ